MISNCFRQKFYFFILPETKNYSNVYFRRNQFIQFLPETLAEVVM